jgi:hypothetical protein
LLIRKKIPYAAILGNHDNEGNLNREQSIAIMSSLPYSLTESGPKLGPLDAKGEQAGGYGNYVVEILAAKSDNSAVSLWLFDTHGYSPDKKKFRGYNWVQQSQIDWFKNEFEARKEAHAKYSYIHLDLAFIHVSHPYSLRVSPLSRSLAVPISFLFVFRSFHTAPIKERKERNSDFEAPC